MMMFSTSDSWYRMLNDADRYIDSLEALWGAKCTITTYSGLTFKGRFEWDFDGLKKGYIDLRTEDGMVTHFRKSTIEKMKFGEEA